MRIDKMSFMTRSTLRRVLLGFVLALLLLPGIAQAQAQRITFNEAVQIALEQNIALKRSANTVELQEATVASERADFLPNLNFSSSSTRTIGLNFDQTTGRTFNETTDRANFSLSSGVNLFNGFGDVASLSQARYNLEASDLSYERQRQTVVFTVMSNYLTLIEQQEQIAIQEENLAAQQQQLTQIEEFTRVGSRPLSDLYQQQAAVANAELNLLNAERLYQLSEISLIQNLQLDPFGTYEFVVPNVEEIEPVLEQYDVRQMLQNAFEERPDLQAQQVSIEAASEGIRVARAGIYPSLSLSGGVGTGYSSQSFVATDFNAEGEPIAFERVAFFDQFTDNRAQSVTLSLSVPIFNRLQTRTNVERARVQYDNARLDLEDIQQDIALQVRQAYLDYERDEKRLQVTEVQFRAAEQALEAEQERYNVGASTLVELSQARANFVQASSDRAQAKYDFLFRKRLIEYYTGVLDPTRPLFE